MKCLIYKNNSGRSGIISIPIILSLTILILAVSGSITAVSFNEGTISFSFSESARALLYAEAGVKDALEKLARNMNIQTNGYIISFDGDNGCASGVWSGCATVRIDSMIDTTVISPAIITSVGRIKNSIRKIQVDAVFNSVGEIINTTSAEIKNLQTASTASATSITSSAATLNGWTNPNGNSVSGKFRYASTSPGVCNDAFGTATGVSSGLSGTNPVSFTQNITSGLASNTYYYYCAIVSDGTTNVFGRLFVFKTNN